MRCALEINSDGRFNQKHVESYPSSTGAGVAVNTTAQLHSTKCEIMFCTGSNPGCSMSEIRDN